LKSLTARTVQPELLDGALLDPAELRRNLREMAMLNRLPGGVGTSLAAIRRLLPDGNGEVLDVGTGGGDLPRRLLRVLPRARVIATDARREVLDLARAWCPDDVRLQVRRADVRSLPFADGSVDVVHCSLLLHHLDPADARVALREMRRVARRGVVVNDLRRGPLALAVTAVTVLGLARGRYTRHDGVLSARRAYTLAELDALAADAGLQVAWRSPAFLPRVVTVYR
jgi:SAM-dependent methyltransferase